MFDKSGIFQNLQKPIMIFKGNLLFSEPPPRVSAPVRRILENSKVRRVDGQVIKPKYNARQFAQLRKKYITAGYYWPDKPMRDRNLDRAPAGGIREKRREER